MPPAVVRLRHHTTAHARTSRAFVVESLDGSRLFLLRELLAMVKPASEN